MTSSKQIIQHAALWLGMLLVGNASMASAATEATVNITATFVAPTCELTVPSTVYLGSIRNGPQTYNPFNLQVNCSTPTSTAIYAQALGSGPDGGTPDIVSMETVPAGGVGAKFWLKEDKGEGNIILTGDPTKAFCEGGNTRACTLIPNTNATSNTTRGETFTIIRFNIRYDG